MRKFHPSYDLLTLENFQSIKNRTEIPIRPLTFLYGPNSAGKSSVLDALRFMEAFFKSERSVVRQMIERWVHITKSNEPSDVQDATCITVAVKFTDEYSMFHTGEPFWSPDDGDLPAEFQNSPLLDKNKLKSKSDSLNTLDTIGISIKADSRDLDLLSLTVFSNGTNILKISPVEDGDNYDYEGRDDCILELFYEGFGIRLADLAKRHANFQEEKTSYKSPCNLRWGQINLAGHSSHSYPFERDLIAIGNSILKYLKLLTFIPPNVASDRGTLLNHHLITFQSSSRPSLKTRSKLTLAPALVFDSLMNLSPKVMDELAASKFQEQAEIWTVDEESQPRTPVTDSDTAMLAFNRGLGQVLKGLTATSRGPETLHTFVNRCLSEHLFLDQGYQLTYDVCRVFPSELSGSTNDQVFAALIVCALIDNAGRSLTFEDVGTGIPDFDRSRLFSLVSQIRGCYKS